MLEQKQFHVYARKKPESFRILKKKNTYNEEFVTISQSLIKSDYVNFFVQMVRSSGFKILFGSLKNLANVNQQLQCCNHKRKSGTNQILRHEIHVSDTNHIISNEKTVLNYEKSILISTLYVMKILCCSAESRFLLSVDEDNMTKQPGVHAFYVLD